MHCDGDSSSAYRPDASHATLNTPCTRGRLPTMIAVAAWATMTLRTRHASRTLALARMHALAHTCSGEHLPSERAAIRWGTCGCMHIETTGEGQGRAASGGKGVGEECWSAAAVA